MTHSFKAYPTDPWGYRRTESCVQCGKRFEIGDHESEAPDPLDEPIAVTLPRRAWLVVVGAAESDSRVPIEQGDGGSCLAVIRAAITSNERERT